MTESHWTHLHEWASRSGLDVIACIAPQQPDINKPAAAWDPRNALDLISFSDRMGYNTSWQLGYGEWHFRLIIRDRLIRDEAAIQIRM